MHMALALSVHTPRVQLGVCDVSASWSSKLETLSRYLAIGYGTPVNHRYYY